ncbi:unnamed protein product [Brugia pahangi]|uniref:Pentatricopeptide repeat-containing protein n=1 Tax=Brugia pahangi TaxID=6280 RepID=A0A0N4SX55_BRUPA|nr:unnamed protein product [Brugia pahangi]
MLLGHCTTLFLLNEIWKPRDAVKVADATHMEIMRNVLVESSTKYTACAISLIYSVLKACSTLKANCQLIMQKLKRHHAQNSGTSKTEICVPQMDDDFQVTTSRFSN